MLSKRPYENLRNRGERVPEKKSRSLYIRNDSKNMTEMLQVKKKLMVYQY